jgi:hypothetical protein
MPAFIKTPKDEARWAKAKKAAGKTLSESDGDSFWALTNSIYQKMTKSQDNDIAVIEAILLKARRRLSDEPDEEEHDYVPEEAGMREFDPDEDDETSKWLEENDPEYKADDKSEENENEPNEYQEYGPGEDEDAHQQDPGDDDESEEYGGESAPEVKGAGIGRGQEAAREGGTTRIAPQEGTAQEEVSGSRFPQPTREELAEMRQYARPWEQYSREKTRLEADPSKNPVLAHEGKLVEARNMSHGDYQDAYNQMQASPDYQSADPVSQMEMDSKFEADWHKQNPEYLANAAKVHAKAHAAGLAGMGEGYKTKKESIQHARRGGAQAEDAMSTEEAMQHAGGTKGEEGTTGSIVQDPASKFAREHSKFLSEKGQEHEDRAGRKEGFYAKAAKQYADKYGGAPAQEGKNRDISEILGEHPGLKGNPKAKERVNSFFNKYHPMIDMNARRVMKQLGLEPRSMDMGSLHEAGMHGLFQAINDYNHDNSGKASFSTHVGNKMRGLMQTALREQQAQPLRTEAKKYDLKQLVAKHPPEIGDRMKRIQTFKQATPKVPKPSGEGGMNE